MSDVKTNGIGTAADFKQLAEAAAWTEPERVVLPCGLGMIIRRPTLMYFRLVRAAWPEALLEKVERRNSWPVELREKITAAVFGTNVEFTPQEQALLHSEELTLEEQRLLIRGDSEMLQKAIVAPKLSMQPDGGEIHPDWLLGPDKQFILKYLGGEVLANGIDLETFSGSESRPAADGGGAGGEISGAAVEVAAKSDAGLAH